jgi:ribose 5-phosphate isomerase B
MIYIGADHAGYKQKEKLKKYFDKKSISYADLGAEELIKDDDYPDYAEKVALNVSKSKDAKGILICGGANGMAISANKIKGIRAAVAWDKYTAKMSVKDDHANILAIAARNLNSWRIMKIVKAFISTDRAKSKRHIRRVKKISQLEKNN